MRERSIPFLLGAVVGAVVVAVLLVALTDGSPTPRPGASPSPAGSAAAVASPVPSGSAALPTPFPTLTALRTGGVARVAASTGIRLRDSMGGPWQKPPARIGAGALVYLDQHRTDGEGEDWWAVASLDNPWTYGWVDAHAPSAAGVLEPATPTCPDPDNLTASVLQTLSGGLGLACFGSRELAFRGSLGCHQVTADAAIGGVSWLNFGVDCIVDTVLGVQGPGLQAVPSDDPSKLPSDQRAEIRGHFDDAESRACFRTGIGLNLNTPINPPEPAAVLLCRTIFAVTSVTPLP